MTRIIHCTGCGLDLPPESFRKARAARPTMKKGRCKKCESACTMAWNKANPEKVKKNLAKHRPQSLIRMAKWNRANRAYLTEYMRGYRENNRERVNEINAASQKKYREKRRPYNTERQVRRRAQVASWANLDAIRAIYVECRRLTKETGIPHHVDHIIPLNGKNVSGLHVETNLQILMASENCRKRNTVMEAAY